MKLYLWALSAAAIPALAALSASAGTPSNAYVELQGIEQGGPAAYQKAADGSVAREGEEAPPVQASPRPAVAAPSASAPVRRVADAEPPAPSSERYERSYERYERERFERERAQQGGGGISWVGAGIGAAAGYGAAVLVSATLYCLPLWGILAFVAGGALLGGYLLKKFF